ncbi:MAG: HAD family phosphatase, partial [Candidatus Fermentibacteraceae bacterium]|nr:HAD family phosphatase [Candidatus Fermentibacteraceae bacterium]
MWNNAQAIVFDFDGVLADSEPFYRMSWNCVLERYGHTISEEIYWKYWAFLGKGLEGEIARTGLVVPDREAVRVQQRSIYNGYCANGDIPLFPLAVEVLDAASRLKKCVIASNTRSSLVRSILERRVDTFPGIIGGEGLRSKPFPDIFLRASEYLCVEPSRCLVFEDAWKGIKAAGKAGMPAVLVRNRCNAGLQAPEAACEIAGLSEL